MRGVLFFFVRRMPEGINPFMAGNGTLARGITSIVNDIITSFEPIKRAREV